MSGIARAFLLTLVAGMATAIGSVIAFAAKRTNFRFLSFSTGFSAGVMLYVAFVELFADGSAALAAGFGKPLGYWIHAASFFGGILLIALIDSLIPSAENPHETHAEREYGPLQHEGAPWPRPSENLPEGIREPAMHDHGRHDGRLMRMGLLTALAIAIHNLPEGLATFFSALHDPALGLAIAGAVALHNIPEGISVSVPIYYATGNRRKAFLYSALSGIAEPVGAILAYLAIRLFLGGQGGVMPPQVIGILFGIVAGIMVYISLDELLPASRAYGKGHDSLFGLMAGMIVMAVSLLLLK